MARNGRRRYEGPAARLEGRELANGWAVGKRLDRPLDSEGELYSVGYEVRNRDGRAAYMKAHDYARAINDNVAEFSRVLAGMLDAHNFERDLNEHCTSVNLSRVVHVLDAGALTVQGSEIPVNYLIFELATGDIRERLGDFNGDGLAWKLETIHQVGTGLSQLHRSRVMHQNLKPSSLMDFGDSGSKVGDLARAWFDGRSSPLAQQDPVYAPPECLYEFELPDVEARLKARDLYMFGSVILFMFGGGSATCALLTNLPIGHHPGATAAEFEQALPHLIEASDKVADQLEESLGDPRLNGIADRFRELCNPDPRRRGHPDARGRHVDPYGLERYVSYFDHLAKTVDASQ